MNEEMKTRKIEFIVEATNTGFSAYASKYPIYAVGENYTELKQSMKDGIDTYLMGVEEEWNYELVPRLDVPQFFKFYKVINATAFAEMIGMQGSLLRQYISGYKTPGVKNSERIISGLRQVVQELSKVEFRELA